MEAIFLGTGTSQGVPMIACGCPVCRSPDPRNRRSRTSLHVVLGAEHIQVDAGQEFRTQCLREGVEKLDHFILTHGHADHILGMDDLRRFCDLRAGGAITVHTTPAAMDRVRSIYPYAQGERPAASGYPAFVLREMPARLQLAGGSIRSVRLPHGAVETLGLVFEEAASGRRLAYYTDCKSVPEEARELARGADVLVLDGLRPDPHPTHLCLPEAIEVAAEIGAARTYLIHLTHAVDHATWSARLPAGVHLAFDGLRLNLGRDGVVASAGD